WGEEEIVIKPFLETTTFKNLEATRVAVVNLTDDVMLFAQGAIGNVQFSAVPAAVVRGVILEAACSWREVEVRTLDASPPRARIVTRVVHRGIRREFLGFNRARHAVLEAAILATRTHLLPADQIRAEFARLQVIVDKTAGPRELEAMALLNDYVRARGARLGYAGRARRGARERRVVRFADRRDVVGTRGGPRAPLGRGHVDVRVRGLRAGGGAGGGRRTRRPAVGAAPLSRRMALRRRGPAGEARARGGRRGGGVRPAADPRRTRRRASLTSRPDAAPSRAR